MIEIGAKVVAANRKDILMAKAKRYNGKHVLVVDRITTGRFSYTVRNVKTGEIRQYKYVQEV